MCFLESLYNSLRLDGACSLDDMGARFPNAPLHTLQTGLFTLLWYKYAYKKRGLFCAFRNVEPKLLCSLKLVDFEHDVAPRTQRESLDLIKTKLAVRPRGTHEIAAALAFSLGKVQRVLRYGADLGEVKIVRKGRGRVVYWGLVE